MKVFLCVWKVHWNVNAVVSCNLSPALAKLCSCLPILHLSEKVWNDLIANACNKVKNLLPHPGFPPVILAASASCLCCLLLWCSLACSCASATCFKKKKLILLCWVHKLNLAPINSNKRKCSAKEEGQDPHQLGTREGMSWRSNSWCLWCLWVIVLAGRVVLCSNLGFHTGFVGSHEVLLLCFNQFLKNVVMLLFLSTGYTFFWSMLSHPLLDFVWYGLSGRLARGRGTDWLV